MKSILTSIGAFFIVAFAMGQSANFPMLTDAYGDQKVNEMMADQPQESLLKLEAFAQSGWIITDKKGSEELETISVPANEMEDFNPLKYELTAVEGGHQYFQIEGTNQVVIVYSSARQEVLYKRFLSKLNNTK
ncbi:MAG: hypothetical protein ACPGED_02970 [Flavobacteriales bacterium]